MSTRPDRPNRFIANAAPAAPPPIATYLSAASPSKTFIGRMFPLVSFSVSPYLLTFAALLTIDLSNSPRPTFMLLMLIPTACAAPPRAEA